MVKNSCTKVPLFLSQKNRLVSMGSFFVAFLRMASNERFLDALAFLWFSKSLVVYSLENSHFDLEAKNGGLVQMVFPLNWVIFRFPAANLPGRRCCLKGVEMVPGCYDTYFACGFSLHAVPSHCLHQRQQQSGRIT